MESFLCKLTLGLSVLHSATAWKQPAPIYAVDPQPFEYQNWLPPLHSHGSFGNRNQSTTPWHPYPPFHGGHHPYPPHGQCAVQHPRPQWRFWLPDIPHTGTSPFLVNGSDYKVYRNVRDFGARGDGVTDDSAAFNAAIQYGGRCLGGLCNGGTTGKPALIYVPPGSYLIGSTIQMYIDTQIIGDAIHLPTLKVASNIGNNSVVIAGYDPAQPSTVNFYIGIRNLNIDSRAADPEFSIYLLNWAVSQATSLFNVNFIMPADSAHVGIEMDGGDSGGGSGLHMSDLTFAGGVIGIRFNNQQYAIRNVKCTNVATCIAVQHAFVLTLLQFQCDNVGICVDAGQNDVTGSLNLLDSSCNNCKTMANGTTSMVLENIGLTNSGAMLTTNGTIRVRDNLLGKTYAQGHIYYDNSGTLTVSNGTYLPYTNRGTLTAGDGRYFTKPQPQYTQYDARAFVSVKAFGAQGDGRTDDTVAIQAALNANANCRITYFPHGVYVLTNTLVVPPGSRLVGEVWSVLSASGSYFSDASNPRPMLQVGRPGDSGLAEFTDLLFTVADVLPGAILVEVNIRGTNQGDVSFHNCHYRIGGAADSKTETACQTTSDPCPAAFLLTYLTSSSSTYIENAWLWSADHDLDGDYNQQIGTGRGMLVEATAATWLVGTGSEHHTLYAYQLDNAQNVFAAMMQVETPYWQPSPRAPAPWTPDARYNDPTFAGCDANIAQCYMQWALRIIGSNTRVLALYGQGFWVFFNGPNYGPCTGPQGSCQVNILDLGDDVEGEGLGVEKGDGVYVYNLNTRGVLNMVMVGGSGGQGVATQAANEGSWGGVIAAYLGFA